VSAQRRATLAATLLFALACTRCASGPVEPVVDLTPWEWTWSQAFLGDLVIRYGHPDEPPPAAPGADPTSLAVLPFEGVAGQTRFASHRYGCAQAERAADEDCSVLLEFFLLELEPPLAVATLTAWRERVERSPAGEVAHGRRVLQQLARDERGREWYLRSLTLESGASLTQFSRPFDARRVIAVSTLLTRAPDRVAARELARDAIGRIRVEAAQPVPR
jgi:hypothetical protein